MEEKVYILDCGVSHCLNVDYPEVMATQISGYLKRQVHIYYKKRYDVVDGVITKLPKDETVNLVTTEIPKKPLGDILSLCCVNYQEKELANQVNLTFDSDKTKHTILGLGKSCYMYMDKGFLGSGIIITRTMVQLGICKDKEWGDVVNIIDGIEDAVDVKVELDELFEKARNIYRKFWCRGVVYSSDDISHGDSLYPEYRKLYTSNIGSGESFIFGLKNYTYPLEQYDFEVCGEYISENRYLPISMWENGDFDNVKNIECIYDDLKQ